MGRRDVAALRSWPYRTAVAACTALVMHNSAFGQSASAVSKPPPLADAPAQGPACLQPGMTGTFFDLSSGQAQYLADQFPFPEDTPGGILSTLKSTQTVVTTQLNFASPELLNPGIPRPGPKPPALRPWPHTFPDTSNGTVAIFETVVRTPAAGFWTFFISTSSPIEVSVSKAGKFFEVLQSGDETDVINSTAAGIVHQVQYALPQGDVDLRVEWHQGLPGDPATSKLLVLEWAFLANQSDVPSPSAPQFFRQLVPANALWTSCLSSNSSGPAEPPSLSTPPQPAPSPADQELAPDAPPVAPALPVLPAPPLVGGPSPESAAPAAPPQTATAACTAEFVVQGPYQEAAPFQAVLTLTLSSTAEPLSVPYNVTVSNPSYTAASDAFNWQVASSAVGGVLEGTVTEAWAALQPGSKVGIGARITSASMDFTPASVTLAGSTCTLSPA